MKRRMLRIIAPAILVLLLGIVPVAPGHAVGQVSGGFNCMSDSTGNRLCGVGFFDILTGQPGQNAVSVAFTCVAVTVTNGVAARVAPEVDRGCELRQGNEQDDPSTWTHVTDRAPGIGQPKATAETAKVTGFVPTAPGSFGVCWEVGGIFVNGRALDLEGCGADLIRPEELPASLLAILGA